MFNMKGIDDFLIDIINICKKHNLSIGHEDTHGAFLIFPYDEDLVTWLKNARDGGEHIVQ